MPIRPMTPCNKPGCANLTNSKYCEEHKGLEKPAFRKRNNDYDKNRPTAAKRGYDGKWRAYRDKFLKIHPYCKMCGQPATVVDHVIPHKGNKGLFWTPFNHQALCKPCHDRKTRTQDMGAWK